MYRVWVGSALICTTVPHAIEMVVIMFVELRSPPSFEICVKVKYTTLQYLAPKHEKVI
jgi:hypothetical protein